MTEQKEKTGQKDVSEESSFISAPFGDELKFKDTEFVMFQKLIDWQAASEKSRVVLGKPLS